MRQGFGRLLACAALALALPAAATGEGRVTYLANEGLLVESGDVKVLFDPLFDNGFGQYRTLPPAMQAALMAGDAPFDGIDAVFVSHFHGDHFAASLVAEYLTAQPAVRLYAPAQAVAALRAEGPEPAILERVTGIAVDDVGIPVELSLAELDVTVLRVPHSGWPGRNGDVENLVFRVTLDDSATVAHFGDADPNPVHFAAGRAAWQRVSTDLAAPPYWFFLSGGGLEILDDIVRAKRAVGTHVPTTVPTEPTERETGLSDVDLFTRPGETLGLD